jgi:hypothetical protein
LEIKKEFYRNKKHRNVEKKIIYVADERRNKIF